MTPTAEERLEGEEEGGGEEEEVEDKHGDEEKAKKQEEEGEDTMKKKVENRQKVAPVRHRLGTGPAPTWHQSGWPPVRAATPPPLTTGA